MKLRRSLKKLEQEVEDAAAELCSRESHVLRNLGWVSAGVAVLAAGLVIGRELRGRYKFNRRTPYDFYGHAGDRSPDVEYSVGI